MNSHSIIPPKYLIDRKNYLFLYSLLKSIFIYDTEKRPKKIEKLEAIISLIKDKYKIELNRDYSKENFRNIIKYIKTQNIKYPGEILENILLRLFTSVMSIPQNETINKYIYYNLQNIYGIKNKMKKKQDEEIDFIRNFINYERLYPEELKNKEVFFQPYKIILSYLEYFLALIYKLKIETIKNNSKKLEKQYNNTTYKLYKCSKDNQKNNNKDEKNIMQHSIISFEDNIDKILENYKEPQNTKNSTNIISYFFFTLFVNYQTINNRLITFNEDNKDINENSKVPFDYNLISSSMKGYYAILVSTTMRQDDRIRIVSMAENDLAELGMSELGKTIIFNPHITSINYNKNRLFTYYFYYLNKSSSIFENNTIEEVNFYNNFLKDDVDDYLCDILQKFKNLKTLNISNNKLCGGISKFLNKLTLLYRQKKSKLENLNINKCNLNSSSIYELCQCLKSKLCKLKNLYLNINFLNDYNIEPLFDAIKKNNSLKKIYLGRNFIGNSSTDKIGKMISRFRDSLEVLYLNQNEIRNNDNLLRIASRTKIVYSNEEDRNKVIIDLNENQIIKNLDISKNGVDIRNKNHIYLFKSLINDTYLSCLDFSVIFKDYEHHEYLGKDNYDKYKKEIEKLINNLKEIKEQRNIFFDFYDEIKFIQNKYNNKFEEYIENKKLNEILEQTIEENENLSIYKDTENLISKELLKLIEKTEEDLNDDENKNFVINLIKYMLLYKVNGGLIKKWLSGINKCLVII